MVPGQVVKDSTFRPVGLAQACIVMAAEAATNSLYIRTGSCHQPPQAGCRTA